MFQVASGSGLSVGLVSGDGPPLSPETIGRSPSFLEAPPAPVKPLSELLPPPPVPLEAVEPAPEPVEEAPPAAARRLVVRLLGGEEVELGSYGDRESAVAAAQALIARFAAAEAADEWPEVEGRFLRPGSVASVDILVETG